MTAIPELTTARLRLRAPREADHGMYARFYGDAEASAFYGGPLSAAAAWSRLARDLGHWALRGYGLWVVERRDDGEAVGACGLYWPAGWPRSELTWWILPHQRRQGFAAEASRAAITFGHEIPGWSRVETHCDDANGPARALIDALGGQRFTRERFPDGPERDVFEFPRPAKGAA
ncbi:GNAT family N-acetyltransferase [Brevundimonas sp.]|uniref:GNAT family N-acetyltransferase n=1 Tax=Brevundimonas sp. TaxID=1871086 RepID=UPI002D3507E8|nr:GNAT family N-acetyltransferase [Brevundimonas sp.]HYC75759.1 GNAT family N-acetyltransferase [Brevundimonas sp.]